ncbi:uncharacterized protein LOC130992068 [Salvia miltiorrhiza]|uniref:uncharacterized protein LOC130992068 n=1 Tax=Salvia miltiorrhiza TaxID=226208 RepID=UPI0025AC21F3|nr:uncharacterized protein LOC130992068 [Salvia miltiorrhiza]
MGNSNSLSCLACILPCGALDLIRIVHSNGYVEELTGRVTAGDVLKNYPDHALSKPCAGAASRRVSPESDLKRGSIYFLVPSSSLPPAHHKTKQTYHSSSKHRTPTKAEKKKPCLRRRKVTAGDWHPHLDSISEDL